MPANAAERLEVASIFQVRESLAETIRAVQKNGAPPSVELLQAFAQAETAVALRELIILLDEWRESRGEGDS